jgi:integrase
MARLKAPVWNASTGSYDHPPMRGVFEKHKGTGKWYCAVLDEKGERHRELVGGYEAACNRYSEARDEARQGKYVAPSGHASVIRRAAATGPTFEELAQAHLDREVGRVSDAFHSENAYKKRRLCEHFELGKIPAAQVTAEVINGVLAKIAKKASGATANRYRTFLGTVFAQALALGKVPANPIAKITVPKFKEKKGRTRFLTQEEEAALRREIQKRCPELEAELDLEINTGLRRGELFRIQRQNVNLQAGVLTVDGKTGERSLPLNAKATAAIRTLLARGDGSNVIPEFQGENARGGPADAKHIERQKDWRRGFEECVKAAGIRDFRYHDLRHTFASRLIMKGRGLKEVQELLGHTSLAMTLRYAHLAPGTLRSAVEALDDAPAPSPAPANPPAPEKTGRGRVVQMRKAV